MLVVDREEWNISDRGAVEVGARLKKVLQSLIVLIGPGQRKEVCVVYSPVIGCCERARIVRHTLRHSWLSHVLIMVGTSRRVAWWGPRYRR
jgi:hypothetical protein